MLYVTFPESAEIESSDVMTGGGGVEEGFGGAVVDVQRGARHEASQAATHPANQHAGQLIPDGWHSNPAGLNLQHTMIS